MTLNKKTSMHDNEGIIDKSEILLNLLPTIAKHIIIDRAENNNFLKNPDDPKEHVLNWHQFGIITHTQQVLKAFKIEAPKLFAKWKVDSKINCKINGIIEGKSKSELIEIGIILHDIGKFARNFKNENGKLEHNFYGHEATSEQLIKQDEFVFKLLYEDLGYTNSQVEYIGRIAGLHFELGKSRDAARKASHGYSIEFSKSDECTKSCLDISANFIEFKEEIGILFLCDSLGKTDIRINSETDDEIALQDPFIKQILEERKLNPSLIAAIKQLPVNIAIVKRYLEIL
jgi:hypothetical protein